MPLRRFCTLFFLLLTMPLWTLLAGCNMNPTGLQMSPGWDQRSVAVWRHLQPDMMALSPSGKWLYISCETFPDTNVPSLVAINMQSARENYLLSGLIRADALKFAPDGSLWMGEDIPNGLIWRIADIDKLPLEQMVDRPSMNTSNDSIAPFRVAGTFAHVGLSFSQDGHYAYMADAEKGGSIYRLELAGRNLSVLDASMRWRAISDASDARAEARRWHAASFGQLEDMETLPDGRIVMAENKTGKVLVLTDHGSKASIETLLQDARITHPDNLAWDKKRHLLWITDDGEPSTLWAWDGHQARRIALHKKAKITGVLPIGDNVFINLQARKSGPDLTMRLFEHHAEETGS